MLGKIVGSEKKNWACAWGWDTLPGLDNTWPSLLSSSSSSSRHPAPPQPLTHNLQPAWGWLSGAPIDVAAAVAFDGPTDYWTEPAQRGRVRRTDRQAGRLVPNSPASWRCVLFHFYALCTLSTLWLHYFLHIFVLVFVFRCCFARFFVFVWPFAMRLSAATATRAQLPTYIFYTHISPHLCVYGPVYREPVKCSWKLQCLQLAAFVCCCLIGLRGRRWQGVASDCDSVVLVFGFGCNWSLHFYSHCVSRKLCKKSLGYCKWRLTFWLFSSALLLTFLFSLFLCQIFSRCWCSSLHLVSATRGSLQLFRFRWLGGLVQKADF